MRFSLLTICVLAFVFLSGCGEKDPAKDFIGKWTLIGSPDKGIILNEDKSGFMFYPDGTREIEWNAFFDQTASVSGGQNFKATLNLDGSFLVLKTPVNDYSLPNQRTIRYERAK